MVRVTIKCSNERHQPTRVIGLEDQVDKKLESRTAERRSTDKPKKRQKDVLNFKLVHWRGNGEVVELAHVKSQHGVLQPTTVTFLGFLFKANLCMFVKVTFLHIKSNTLKVSAS